MRKKKKRHIGLLIFVSLLVVGAVVIFSGRTVIIDGVKGKAAKEITKKLIETQLGNDVTVGDKKVNVSQVIDNMEEEDVKKVTDIAEKYISEESIGEYIDMAKQGDISQIKDYVQDNLTDTDKEELKSLYDKYKDQIPLN